LKIKRVVFKFKGGERKMSFTISTNALKGDRAPPLSRSWVKPASCGTPVNTSQNNLCCTRRKKGKLEQSAMVRGGSVPFPPAGIKRSRKKKEPSNKPHAVKFTPRGLKTTPPRSRNDDLKTSACEGGGVRTLGSRQKRSNLQ